MRPWAAETVPHQAGGLRGDLLGKAAVYQASVRVAVAGHLCAAARGLRLRRLPLVQPLPPLALRLSMPTAKLAACLCAQEQRLPED